MITEGRHNREDEDQQMLETVMADIHDHENDKAQVVQNLNHQKGCCYLESL